MGRRSEQRIAISFPVIVRGTDSRGTPFAVTTKTVDISFSGAALKGLNAIAEVGSRVEIECRDQKALYRVQRVSQGQTPGGGCVGLRCLEMGKYIWGVPPKEWEADTYDPANPGKSAVGHHAPDSGSGYGTAASWKGQDGRQFARHACRIEAQVYLDSLLVVNQMKGIFKVKNRDLWPIHDAIKQLAKKFKKISFSHVPREFNKLADAAVNRALDEQLGISPQSTEVVQ